MNDWKTYLTEHTESTGKPPSFFIRTMGCQMNERDSETIAGLLSEMGFMPAKSNNEADVILINTCSVRENADQRFFGVLGQLKKIKESKPDTVVGVCGCMMQQQHIIDGIKEKYAWVDLIFGTHNIHSLPELLKNTILEKSKNIEIWEDGGEIIENLPSKREFPFKAYVNIMYGCNNFCTYCIVPYTRGRERSRKPEDIIREVTALVDSGVKEIMLLGQNVNSYRGSYHMDVDPLAGRSVDLSAGRSVDLSAGGWVSSSAGGSVDPLAGGGVGSSAGDVSADYSEFAVAVAPNFTSDSAGITGAHMDFPELIYRLNDIDGLKRIRFMTSHPKDLSDKLAAAYRDCDKLCKLIHLPVQSGSSRILALMNRKYTKEYYLHLIAQLRSACPHIAISTDIITGFPGETEEDFEETMDLIEKVRFDSAFTFLYSARKGTPAATFENQVPEDVKHKRFNRLVDRLNTITAEKNHEYTGRVENLLVEGPSKTGNGMMAGRTDSGKQVNFKGDITLTGHMANVRITEARTFSLLGELV